MLDAGLAAILKEHGAWITVPGVEADDEEDSTPIARLVRRWTTERPASLGP